MIHKTETWPKLEEKLRTQYDEVQKRSSGEYKRNAKNLSFAVGLIIAAIANANIFNMINILNKTNRDFSSQLISKIERSNIIKNPEKPQNFSPQVESTKINEFTSDEKKAISGILQDISILPLGWNYDDDLKKYQAAQNLTAQSEILKILDNPENKNNCTADIKKTWEKCFDDVSTELTKDENLFISLDKRFREAFTTLETEDAQKSFPTTYNATVKSINEKLRDAKKKILKRPSTINSGEDFNQWFAAKNVVINKQGGWLSLLLGWVISALAISMGAPFWFDILSKTMNVRNTGKDIMDRDKKEVAPKQ